MSSGDNQGNNEGELDGEELDSDKVDWEFVQGIPWQYHPVCELLQEALINKEIPTDHKLMEPLDVWNKCCDADIFEGMECDAAFKRRLLALRKQVRDGQDRATMDLNYFQIAKKNHPPPARNHRDEPQWNGSDVQRLLKIDMDNKKHFDLKPEDLWESRAEHGEFYLSTFRDHLWQEHKTRKYLYTLKLRANEKAEKRIDDAKKKFVHEESRRKAENNKEIKAAEKARKAEEKAAKKLRQAEEKEAEKARKAEAKAAEKLRKAEEKESEKVRKAEAKAAAKEQAKLAAKKKKDDEKAAAKAVNQAAKPKASKKGGNKTKGAQK